MNVKVNKKNGIRLKTKNKLLKEDIVITTGDELVQPEGNIEIKSAKEYNVSNYKTAQIVSDTLLPENIIKDVNILGVRGSIDIESYIRPYKNELLEYKENLWKYSLKEPETTGIYRTVEEKHLEGLKNLRNYAFAYTDFGYIYLPNTIKKIGVGCFEESQHLQIVELSSEITEIPDKCFYSCRNLNIVDNIGNITKIGNDAFHLCSNLNTNFIFSEGLTSIGENAFRSCFKVTKIVLPASLNHIGSNAFMYANAVSIYFKGATPPAEIGTRVFFNVKNMYVPTGSLSAYQEAFSNADFTGTWHEMDPEDME